MNKLSILLTANLIALLIGTQAMAETVLCQSQDQRTQLTLNISADIFPKATIHGSFLMDSVKTEFDLTGWYSQRFDYTARKEFSGYFIPANGKADAEDNYIQTFFEVAGNSEKTSGFAEIRNAQLTGIDGLVKLPCKKQEQ